MVDPTCRALHQPLCQLITMTASKSMRHSSSPAGPCKTLRPETASRACAAQAAAMVAEGSAKVSDFLIVAGAVA
eukprot:6196777-Pleurochrysis_carterae.AAC.2